MALNKRKQQTIDDLQTNKRIHVAETTKIPLKLTDLNEFVLEKIFVYLNAEELVNIVKYDDIFLSSSRRVFQRKYRNEYIQVPLKKKGTSTSTQDFNRNADLLRYFGENISKLEIKIDEMNDDNPLDKRLYHLIVTMCCETLLEMKFWHPTTKFKIHKAQNAGHLLRIDR